MRRRRLRAGVAVATAGMILAVATAASVGFDWGTDPQVQPPTESAVTEQVRRETLIDYITVDGELGYGEGLPLASKATGTVTWLSKAGTTITRGQAVLRVDDLPVVLLYGQLPMYRQLTVGSKGDDVAQFEQNLRALGYSTFTVDQQYSASTATGVKHWQHDLGLPETGVVELDRVVYAAGPLRVAEHLVRIGAGSPADVLSVSGTTKVLIASVPAADAGWAASGVAVTVTLPDGGTIPGKVSSVEGGPTSDDQNGGDAEGTKVRVIISVADQKAIAGLDRGTLTVRYAAREKRDVLTVPVAALLALAEGGYGLEIVGGDSTRIVAVQVGMFAGGRVEVSGADIAAGVTVRMPL